MFVDTGTIVAVNTPVGIELVVEALLRLVVDSAELTASVETGALTITVEGGTVGCPATLLTLPAGVDQLAESLYNTPLMSTPARFAIMFF